jgi:DNA-3-methyladenine glycosylase
LCDGGPLTFYRGDVDADLKVQSGPRVGISTAADVPWRFWIDGDPTVSPYRRHRAAV